MDMLILADHPLQCAPAAEIGGELVAGGTELPVVCDQSRCLVGIWIFYMRCHQEMSGWYGARATDLSYDNPGWPPARRPRPSREGWLREGLDQPAPAVRLRWLEVHEERLAFPLPNDAQA